MTEIKIQSYSPKIISLQHGAVTFIKSAVVKSNEAYCSAEAYAMVNAMHEEIERLKKHNEQLHAAYVRAKTEGY